MGWVRVEARRNTVPRLKLSETDASSSLAMTGRVTQMHVASKAWVSTTKLSKRKMRELRRHSSFL
jgi:hypothetical protein